MRCITRCALTCFIFSGLLTHIRSAEVPELVVDGLRQPCGVAVQPNTAHVFLSESAAGRVVRVVDGQLQEVVVGFPLGIRELTAPVDLGPLDLAFLNAETLAVAGAGHTDGTANLYVVPVPQIGVDPLPADAALALPVADEATVGPLRLHSLTLHGSTLFCAVQTPDGPGGIGQIRIQNAKQLSLAASFQPYQRMTALTDDAGGDYPVSLAVAPRGELVVGQRNRPEAPVDSQLAFYRTTDGRRLLQLPTGLSELTDIAYGARRGSSAASYLYALDGSWATTDGGGLYRLDARFGERGMQIQATRIAVLDKPTAMALGGDGSLYVTVLGTPPPGSDQPAGRLLRFPPGL